jgi:cytochrome c peroxidase
LRYYIRVFIVLFISSLISNACFADSALKQIGEKLFRETRFSQYFATHSQGLWNQLPPAGDPSVEDLLTLAGPVENPYRGQSISCAACHLSNQADNIAGAGTRSFSDFARRSPIPDRGDGLTSTVRNSPSMVGAHLHEGMSLHWDGEYPSAEDLVSSSFTGRNLGWFADEKPAAIHHISEVIRNDDGSFQTSVKQPSYREALSNRIDFATASDQQIFQAVVKLVATYVSSLDFSRDPSGDYNGSPYDLFLRKNNLPLRPQVAETDFDYSTKLMKTLLHAKSIHFVDSDDGAFKLHKQEFAFGEAELHGMRVFFGKGSCIQCHAAPDFTDHLFHNTGVSQDEYDRIHGFGKFMKLDVPNLLERNAHPEIYLPPTAALPQAQSLFRSIPVKEDSRRADLGTWSIFANPSMPKSQTLLRAQLCSSLQIDCANTSDDDLLNVSLGLFKTPTCRDLGQSEPYLHTGQANKIEDVLRFYIKYGMQARMGKVRNGDPHLRDVDLSVGDIEDVALFLKSLNEDIEN